MDSMHMFSCLIVASTFCPVCVLLCLDPRGKKYIYLCVGLPKRTHKANFQAFDAFFCCNTTLKVPFHILFKEPKFAFALSLLPVWRWGTISASRNVARGKGYFAVGCDTTCSVFTSHVLKENTTDNPCVSIIFFFMSLCIAARWG